MSRASLVLDITGFALEDTSIASCFVLKGASGSNGRLLDFVELDSGAFSGVFDPFALTPPEAPDASVGCAAAWRAGASAPVALDLEQPI